MDSRKGEWTLVELFYIILTVIVIVFIFIPIGGALYKHFFPPKADEKMLGTAKAFADEIKSLLGELDEEPIEQEFPVYMQEKFQLVVSDPKNNDKHPPVCKQSMCVCLSDAPYSYYRCYLSGRTRKNTALDKPYYLLNKDPSKNKILYVRFYTAQNDGKITIYISE